MRFWCIGRESRLIEPLFDLRSTNFVLVCLPKDLSEEQLGGLDAAFGFSDTRNAEIGRTWFIQVAERQYRPAYDKLEQHLNRYGRTRLVAPVYRALAENGSDMQLAQEMFANARGSYHPITIAKISSSLEKDAE